ncbi:MAG: dihydrofolate reductase [Candidatus Paceibacterota bacterium]
MLISIIVAISQNGTIGSDGRMPWNIPEDTKRFRELTLKKPVIMGRKTHESIGGRLSERHNIVLTHQEEYVAEGCTVVHSTKEALECADKGLKKYDNDEVMIIGGGSVYDQFLPLSNRIYLTKIYKDFSGDSHFSFDRGKWKEIKRDDRIGNEDFPDYSFIVLEKK